MSLLTFQGFGLRITSTANAGVIVGVYLTNRLDPLPLAFNLQFDSVGTLFKTSTIEIFVPK